MVQINASQYFSQCFIKKLYSGVFATFFKERMLMEREWGNGMIMHVGFMSSSNH